MSQDLEMLGKPALMINSILRSLVRKEAIKEENVSVIREALLEYAFAATIDSDIRREVHYLSGVE